MQCPNCNRAIDNDSIYCTYCGTRVTQNTVDITTISSDSNIINLLAKKRVLEAVKYCVEQYNMGLKEAKYFVDKMRKKI